MINHIMVVCGHPETKETNCGEEKVSEKVRLPRKFWKYVSALTSLMDPNSVQGTRISKT